MIIFRSVFSDQCDRSTSGKCISFWRNLYSRTQKGWFKREFRLFLLIILGTKKIQNFFGILRFGCTKLYSGIADILLFYWRKWCESVFIKSLITVFCLRRHWWSIFFFCSESLWDSSSVSSLSSYEYFPEQILEYILEDDLALL